MVAPYVGPVKLVRQVIAALMLVFWISASAHLALEHGGATFGVQLAGLSHDHSDGHHHGETDEEHHHHNLGAVTHAQIKKGNERPLLIPAWQPIAELFLDQLRLAAGESARLPIFGSDGRAELDHRWSGWLLVARTALPVRGPSLAA